MKSGCVNQGTAVKLVTDFLLKNRLYFKVPIHIDPRSEETLLGAPVGELARLVRD